MAEAERTTWVRVSVGNLFNETCPNSVSMTRTIRDFSFELAIAFVSPAAARHHPQSTSRGVSIHSRRIAFFSPVGPCIIGLNHLLFLFASLSIFFVAVSVAPRTRTYTEFKGVSFKRLI